MPMTGRIYSKSKSGSTVIAKPLLEQRHYEIIANIISKLPQWNNSHDLRRNVTNHFARELINTNRKFNIDKFKHACNIGVYDE